MKPAPVPSITDSTRHRMVEGDARKLSHLDNGSIDLVVTSPPYPMISMWDDCFSSMNPAAGEALACEDGGQAFEIMHRELDLVWQECLRVLRPGGYCCINIGDATRSVGGRFQLYSNHARILESARKCGFDTLPDIIWRKPTNSPNKFMGSGMLPCGAYVTYEHEYILILRKREPRPFKTPDEKANRHRSAIFWSERNAWFSDLWSGLTGARQQIADTSTRSRSAAFPFEIPYRLILMFSVVGDRVLDPFMGTGTTASAALGSGRNSEGVDLDDVMPGLWESTLRDGVSVGQRRASERLEKQAAFLDERRTAGKPLTYMNEHHGVGVVTRQELKLRIVNPIGAEPDPGEQRVVVGRHNDSPLEAERQGELFSQ